ncbi:dTDP-glucose 4,6-dehydratase [Patescibacteria group bacterium]|nr:dTDP-glucose 4,6-dehydratase [Patescibacteria group bacterium]
MKVLITGGLGFIGSNFIRHMINKYPEYDLINFDKMTYAGNPENLKDIEDNKRYNFVKGDIADSALIEKTIQDFKIEAIINFAAETHVDRSIENPGEFINTDVYGTHVLLEAVKKFKISKFLQISTDEVYGDIEPGHFSKEGDTLRPSSPYSASKAGGDLQVMAFRRTYDLPVLITRCTNNYGPYQYPEKILPLFITNIIEDKKVPVYGQGDQIRDWIHVDDHCQAVDLVFHKGQIGEVYNVGANQDPEVSNLELTKMTLDHLGKGEEMIEYVKDRLGHDVRYAVDCSKIKELGWKKEINLEEGLESTIKWYQSNKDWWKKLKSGEYLAYYKRQYSDR